MSSLQGWVLSNASTGQRLWGRTLPVLLAELVVRWRCLPWMLLDRCALLPCVVAMHCCYALLLCIAAMHSCCALLLCIDAVHCWMRGLAWRSCLYVALPAAPSCLYGAVGALALAAALPVGESSMCSGVGCSITNQRNSGHVNYRANERIIEGMDG